MRARDAVLRTSRAGRIAQVLGAFALVFGGAVGSARGDAPARGDAAEGKELFFREWTAGDARSHGGDGLGPVYNDSSCIACHNAGGAGGAGPASKNVDILTAISNRQGLVDQQAAQSQQGQRQGFLRRALGALVGIETAQPARSTPPPQPRRPDTRELVKAHAGFRTARSVVLHRFATDPDYETWRNSMLGLNQFVPGMAVAGRQPEVEINQVKVLAQFENNVQFQNSAQFGEFSISRSQRNPTALFGAGLIDAIPGRVLEDAARAKHPGNPEVSGRVSRARDGRIGRFGWKAQTPSLQDFVLTACAVELGLEVPGHSQGGLPKSPHVKAQGKDLDEGQCAALVAYVQALPRPIERAASDAPEEKTLEDGKRLFSRAGCNACHTPRLGEVEGIYSDLLLHDMGPELGDTGAYGVFVPDTSEPDFVDPDQPLADSSMPTPVPLQPGPVAEDVSTPTPGGAAVTTTTATEVIVTDETIAMGSNPPSSPPASGPASRQEWRTPPLWGFRDSGPYLHDGRAETLDQAIALHGGEGATSARRYFALSSRDRLKVQAFLKSLVAPTEPEPRDRAAE